MNAFTTWLDDRTGYRDFIREALYENIPGGSRWRYVWGSTLVFTFSVQMITGIFLWMAYSPSSRTAWESVYYIQYEMQGGWFLRGLHHFTAHAMIVLLALHLVQVVIDGAYKAPREINFWLGLILMKIILGLSLTGYLLPWDQKGFWATRVSTNLMGLVPIIGPDLQKVVVGGTSYGHATLTRFFALHAGVLPGMLIFFLVLHVAFFRRHGITAHKPKQKPDAAFWPDQVLKDAVACLAVLTVIVFFVVRAGFDGDHGSQPPGHYLGAELGAPSDAAEPYSAARPEWYFLFLFQFLKYFHGATEVIGAIVIPGLVMGMLFLMPILGRWKLGHRFNIGMIAVLGIGIVLLTWLAVKEDQNDPDFVLAVAEAEENRERVMQLVHNPSGISDDGAISLLRNDPKTQGPKLFERHCASCHAHTPLDPKSDHEDFHIVESRDPSGPNLYKFGRRAWLMGFFDPRQIDGSRYFGDTSHKEGEMVDFVKETLGAEWTPDEVSKVISALAAEAGIEHEDNEKEKTQIAAGRKLLEDTDRCAACHKFHKENEDAYAPDLTGYGSRQWMIDFIGNPSHERFYGDSNDRMPAYAKYPDEPIKNILSQKDLELVVDWLRGDWYEPAKETDNTTEEK